MKTILWVVTTVLISWLIGFLLMAFITWDPNWMSFYHIAGWDRTQRAVFVLGVFALSWFGGVIGWAKGADY